MALRNYLRTLQNAWRFIAICTLAAWVISLAISLTTVPQYRSNASFLIFPNANLTSSRDVMSSLDTLEGQKVIATYQSIFGSERVFNDTLRMLGFDESEVGDYTVRLPEATTSNILELWVEGPNPQTAALLANTVGQNGINYIKGVYQIYDISFLDQASVSENPFKPNTLRNGEIAAAIGLVIGILGVTLSEQLKIPLEALRERSIRDSASSAYNQRHFTRLLEQDVARRPAGPLSLGLIKLDGLDELFDVLPEGILTNLLRKVAETLGNQLYGTDVIGRWDDTIFGVMLPATPEEAAIRTLGRIRQALTGPIEIETFGDRISLVPIAGVASLKEGETAMELITHAEAALEKARQSDDNIAAYSAEE